MKNLIKKLVEWNEKRKIKRAESFFNKGFVTAGRHWEYNRYYVMLLARSTRHNPDFVKGVNAFLDSVCISMRKKYGV